MSNGFLLDTNIVIAFIEEDTLIRQNFAEAEAVFVSSNVLGELYYGAYKSGRVEVNLTRIQEFVGIVDVLGCDIVTAGYYGRIKNILRQKGRPIPENDIWIAAIAIQHELTLVSRDAHFEEVDGLLLERW